MNDRQIQCFLEAGRLLNFTKAAQNLIIPQPAVSRYIATLEAELGVTLFYRENSRKVTFTEAGKTYFNFFQRINIEMRHIQRTLVNEVPILRLGYNVGWNVSDFLPAVIRGCQEQVPDFRITFKCMESKELLQALAQKQLDAVISIENYLAMEPDLEVSRLTSIRRCIIYSELLPDFDKIQAISDFYPYTFFIVDDSRIKELFKKMEGLFLNHHFVPRFLPMVNLDTVFAQVENGLGVAVMDQWCNVLHTPIVHALNLDEQIPVALAWPKHSNFPFMQLFYEELLRFFQH